MYNETNGAKSANGHNLNAYVGAILKDLKNQGMIKEFYAEPKFSYPGYSAKQFNPDYEIHKLNGEIIFIDNTTTARSDRLKQKQWEASGVKMVFKDSPINMKFYVVVPDELRPYELDMFHHEKSKINSPNRFTMIDDLIQIKDLVNILIY